MNEATQARRPKVDSVGLLLPASRWTIDLSTENGRRRAIGAAAHAMADSLTVTVGPPSTP